MYFVRNEKVEQYIKIKTHEPIILKFWFYIRIKTHKPIILTFWIENKYFMLLDLGLYFPNINLTEPIINYSSCYS